MSVRIKICGLTNEQDAIFAAEAGADYLGFVLYPKSPRHVLPQRLREIVQALPPETRKVGVFVNAAVAEVEGILGSCGLDIAQLHGDETAGMARQLGVARVWKAVALRTAPDVNTVLDYPADALLVDSMSVKARGGTGKVCDWALAADLAAQRRVFLAGGLNPANVADAVREVNPFGVDLSSGVEQRPGIKDHGRVREVIAAARSALRN